MIERITGQHRLQAHGWTYGLGYNATNRLTVVQQNGTTVATYGVNGIGERVTKTLAGGATHTYVHDEGGKLLEEYAAGHSRDYVWAGDTLVAILDNPTQGGDTIHYVYTDALGSPRAVTTRANKLVWDWPYRQNPFGEAPASGNGYTLNLRFPGQYHDQETGLDYNVFRDYEPTTGRYIESDPTGLRGGVSTYAYVGDNPVVRVDPMGFIWVTIGTHYHWGQDAARWWYNRQSQQIGNGYELNVPGSNPKEGIGTKRDLIQEWQHDPQHPSRDCEYKVGQKRTIPQTFGSIYGPWQGKDIYTWLPVVASPTYDNY